MEPIDEYGQVKIEQAGNRKLYVIPEADFKRALHMILEDDYIEEVMYNGSGQPLIVFHSKHKMCETSLRFDDKDVWPFIQEAVVANAKPLNEKEPIFDGVLADGSRINVIIPPAATTTAITIRKFKEETMNILDLIKSGFITPEAMGFLWVCLSSDFQPANALVVGGTASGKTTTLNAFAMLIKADERVVIIEDTREIQLFKPNVIRMLSSESIPMDMLIKNSLRMRPDRIIVGEVRGAEAQSMFSAMNTGHDGCLGTLHANSAKESASRIMDPPMSVPISMIGSLDLIIVLRKTPEERFVEEIAEISGVDKEGIRFNTLFEWDASQKKLVPTGIPSHLLTKTAKAAGVSVGDIHENIKAKAAKLNDLVQKDSGREQLLAAINEQKKDIFSS